MAATSLEPAHYVTGTWEPDLATLARIARILETTPNDLLGFGPEPKPSKRIDLRRQTRWMSAHWK
jgi:hypothetical protein